MQVARSTIVDAPVEEVWRALRDFNGHALWHPAVTASVIEDGRPPDEVGCVRRFRLRSGQELREQLLSLSDREHRLTYCLLDAPLALIGYVATVTLKSVTDDRRTFWDWRGSFSTAPGREAELARTVAEDVYEAGFEGFRAFLARGGPAAAHRRHEAQPGAGRVASTRVRARTAITGVGIVIGGHGGPETLVLAPVQAPPPGPGQARVRQTAVGINYLDIYVRTGRAPLLTPPGSPGVEAAGEVIDVGDGVSHVLPGDRVAYACLPVGAYASVRTMDADRLVVLPDHVSDETAAAGLLKGVTAACLLRRVRRVRRGEVIVVHGAAGATGLLLCQWARHLGATTVGTVSTEQKARVAREAGCDYPIVTGREDWVERVREITDGRGADAIYDGVGSATFPGSLEALAVRGHLVSHGQASGAVGPVDPEALAAKSISLSRPVVFDYIAEPAALHETSRAVFRALERGVLRPLVNHRYPLGAAAEAHRDLEGRRTTGSLILLP